jgi:hypothetical protein
MSAEAEPVLSCLCGSLQIGGDVLGATNSSSSLFLKGKASDAAIESWE